MGNEPEVPHAYDRLAITVVEMVLASRYQSLITTWCESYPFVSPASMNRVWTVSGIIPDRQGLKSVKLGLSKAGSPGPHRCSATSR
jgi:hypothetical protein